MIIEVDDGKLTCIQKILKNEFGILYVRDSFSKEVIYIDNNQIVGIIVYSIIYDRMELDYIFVDKLKRKMGIATKLMNYMIEDGRKNDIKNITLEVNVHNVEAISLYKKYGFSVGAIRKGYYNGEDGYLMIRG